MAADANPRPVDLLVEGGWVVTMDADRTLWRNGAVAVDQGRIVAVGPAADLASRSAPRERLGGPDHLVIPGLINAHQHLTGDRLARSLIPDNIESDESIFQWAVPIHAAHSPDDDETSATASLLEAVTNGITFTVEAGTVAYPERILAAYDRVGVGGTLGTWGSDTDGLPYAGPIDHVLDRYRHVTELAAGHDRVHGWVTLVGHDLMSDELVTTASRFAAEHDTHLTMHLSPSSSDSVSYLARTGKRPAVHLADLGALGPHVLLAHAVHLDDAEIDAVLATDTAIAYCPWAYLRLAQGVTGAGRHAGIVERGGRVALGCDAENASDAIDILRAAALAAGLAKDVRLEPIRFGAHTALELATIAGARAIGLDHELGSLEAGKRADVVLIDTTTPVWTPAPELGDPITNLVWAAGASSVDHVVASGRVVVRDGVCTTVDLADLRAEASAAQADLLARAGITPPTPWPIRR